MQEIFLYLRTVGGRHWWCSDFKGLISEPKDQSNYLHCTIFHDPDQIKLDPLLPICLVWSVVLYSVILCPRAGLTNSSERQLMDDRLKLSWNSCRPLVGRSLHPSILVVFVSCASLFFGILGAFVILDIVVILSSLVSFLSLLSLFLSSLSPFILVYNSIPPLLLSHDQSTN